MSEVAVGEQNEEASDVTVVVANADAENVAATTETEDDEQMHDIIKETLKSSAASENIAEESGEQGDAVGQDSDIDMIDIINQSLGKFLGELQKEVDALAEVAAKKRAEVDAADAEAEEKVVEMDKLKDQAQSLADDEQWQSMFVLLKAWRKEHGHCNPRRIWKSKNDAEEKTLGNWSGKQRRAKRLGQLNPFKEAVLKRIGFAFDPMGQKWEDFHSKLKEYLSKYGKLPEKLEQINEKVQDNGRFVSHLKHYRQIPKSTLGLTKKSQRKSGEPFNNERLNKNGLTY